MTDENWRHIITHQNVNITHGLANTLTDVESLAASFAFEATSEVVKRILLSVSRSCTDSSAEMISGEGFPVRPKKWLHKNKNIAILFYICNEYTHSVMKNQCRSYK